ncbi:hypothetical protein ACFX13_038884 [Malus domestica]
MDALEEIMECLRPLEGEGRHLARMFRLIIDYIFYSGKLETIEHVRRNCSMVAAAWFSILGLRVAVV